MKFYNILKNIEQSDGIIFIFSEYIWSGLIPMALVLEHAGFKNIDGNLLNYPEYKKHEPKDQWKTKDVPINYDGITKDKLKKGDNIVLSAFGGGFTWGAIWIKWAYGE